MINPRDRGADAGRAQSVPAMARGQGSRAIRFGIALHSRGKISRNRSNATTIRARSGEPSEVDASTSSIPQDGVCPNRISMKYNSPDAVCWCSIGAICAVDDSRSGDSAVRILADTIETRTADIPHWNDAPDRTQDEVLVAFGWAIEASMERGER